MQKNGPDTFLVKTRWIPQNGAENVSGPFPRRVKRRLSLVVQAAPVLCVYFRARLTQINIFR